MTRVDEILYAIEAWPIAAAVRGETGWGWLFPNIETLHVLSLAVVFGSVFMVDLRLVGLASRESAVSRLSAEALPLTWIAFLCAAITGTLMFVSKAHSYFHNLQFQLKFLCIFLAGLNMVTFHFGIYRDILAWDSNVAPPLRAKVAGGTSLILWAAVIFFGRWIGFTT